VAADSWSIKGIWNRWSGGVWRRPDFRALFAAQTGAVFGTLISRTAIPFAAIIELDAHPIQLAILGAANMAPAFALGLFAGAWIDRLPRKPIMIGCDLIRAAVMALVPLLWLFDLLSMPALYLIAAVISVCSVVFDIAYRSILPSIVEPDELLEGNSRLTGSASVAEAASFSIGGWLVQLLTAPIAVAVNAVTFLWSARWLSRITLEEKRRPKEDREPIFREIRAGLHLVWQNRTLRALAVYSLNMEIAFGMYGVIFMLYVIDDLGFQPGVLGFIFALGGVAAIGGAAIAGRVTSALGFRITILLMTLMMGIGQISVTLASAATIFAVSVLVAQQFLVDGPYTVVDINAATLRQLAASEDWQGRITSSSRVLEFGGGLVGTLAGGLLAEQFGLRPVLIVAGLLIVLNGLVVARLSEPKPQPIERVPDA
jgi:Na+/melibiose symporter-like transporter